MNTLAATAATIRSTAADDDAKLANHAAR